jgi:hypothetical protein
MTIAGVINADRSSAYDQTATIARQSRLAQVSARCISVDSQTQGKELERNA